MAGKKAVLADVSFITTVYNEEENITDLLESLMAQTFLPGEIVIVDGGSEDGTYDAALDFFKNINSPEFGGPEIVLNRNDTTVAGKNKSRINNVNIRLIKKTGANISQGRNTAIKKTSGSIICVGDAGCILDRNWLREITAFYSDSSCSAVGGFNLPLCRSFLQKCLAVCIMPAEKEIKAEEYMPSSRNFSFRREIWSETGGYPEDMEYGEDMKFNFKIKAAGHGIMFNPRAMVYWKMRKTIIQIFWQFFRYAKGDAVGGMYPLRHIIRFAALFTFIFILFSAFFFNKWILTVLIPLFILYILRPYLRLAGNRNEKGNCVFRKFEKFLSIPVIPFLLLLIDFSKICGYIRGASRKI